jgi:hypothetical protein
MANKLNFIPEEWATLLESTMVAGIAVSAADPSGLWGTLKEFFANSSALDAAKRDPHSNELVMAVIAAFDSEEGRGKLQKTLHKRFAEVADPADFVQRSLVSLREASTILDARAPGDAAAFKAWLFSVSQRVAEASTEGGFLGYGGVQVSDAERATLDDIAEALGIADQRDSGSVEPKPSAST